MYEGLVKSLREHAKQHGWDCSVCICLHAEDRGFYTCTEELAAKAADAIEELRDRNVWKWIPVTERLPDNVDEEVLVCNIEYGKSGLGFVTVAIYDGSDWLECWERKTYLTAVTHWMPLPSAPEQPEEETC